MYLFNKIEVKGILIKLYDVKTFENGENYVNGIIQTYYEKDGTKSKYWSVNFSAYGDQCASLQQCSEKDVVTLKGHLYMTFKGEVSRTFMKVVEVILEKNKEKEEQESFQDEYEEAIPQRPKAKVPVITDDDIDFF